MGHVGSSRRAARWGAAVLACALVAPPAASAVTGTEAAAWAADDDARRAAAASLDTEVTTVPGRWIVRAVDGRLDEALAAARGLGVGVDDHFASTINGFAATGNERLATRLRAEPSVQSVRPVQRIAFAATQASAPWNLDRIDQPKRPLDRTYTYAETGKGVHVYVIDSGVRADHAEFGGRVVTGLRGQGASSDCFGHGTHVAGTIAGATHGVAKRATIIPLRVGRPNSSGICGAVDTDRLHAALRFVVDHHKAGQPAVANLSLGGWADPDVDAAVRRVVSDGVSVVAAAGNTGDWACNYSPGRVGAALTVAATDKSDYSPMWSNYGSCVDLFAPGVGIRSAAHTSRTGTVVYDGTSMAAPHVTGAVARYLQGRPGASPKTVHAAIVKSAATGRVSNPGSSTPNRLLLVKGAVPTRLAASASASTTTVDEPIAIRGALTNRVSGTVLAGRTVVLQSRRVGATSWTSVTSKNTDARGEVAFSHQPGRSTEYRLSHGGTALTQAATSQVRTVKVRQSVVAKASADGRGIEATIRPQPVSGDRVTVLLEWQDPSTRTWVEVDRSDWRGAATDGPLVWSATKPPPPGEHRLRVRALATTRNVAGTSAPIRVVVPGEGCTTEACLPAAAPPVFVRG